MAPRGKVHRQVNVAAKRLEPGGVKPADRSDVAGHRPDGQVLMPSGAGFLDHPADEQLANALITGGCGHDDRLYFAAVAMVEQAGHADDRAARLGHPRTCPLRGGQVVIEARAGIVAADSRVAVEALVVLRQFPP